MLVDLTRQRFTPGWPTLLARIPIFRSLGRKQGWISDHVADRRVPQSTRRQAVACGPSPLSFVYKMLNYRGEGRWFVDEWEIFVTDEVREWIGSLDDVSHRLVVQAIDILADRGPALGRPLVDRVEHSSVQNLKELRPGSAGWSELRVLFVFDPWRSAILLVAGDKSGNWEQWYREAVPRAEHLLEVYLKERAEEEGGS